MGVMRSLWHIIFSFLVVALIPVSAAPSRKRPPPPKTASPPKSQPQKRGSAPPLAAPAKKRAKREEEEDDDDDSDDDEDKNEAAAPPTVQKPGEKRKADDADDKGEKKAPEKSQRGRKPRDGSRAAFAAEVRAEGLVCTPEKSQEDRQSVIESTVRGLNAAEPKSKTWEIADPSKMEIVCKCVPGRPWKIALNAKKFSQRVRQHQAGTAHLTEEAIAAKQKKEKGQATNAASTPKGPVLPDAPAFVGGLGVWLATTDVTPSQTSGLLSLLRRHVHAEVPKHRSLRAQGEKKLPELQASAKKSLGKLGVYMCDGWTRKSTGEHFICVVGRSLLAEFPVFFAPAGGAAEDLERVLAKVAMDWGAIRSISLDSAATNVSATDGKGWLKWWCFSHHLAGLVYETMSQAWPKGLQLLRDLSSAFGGKAAPRRKRYRDFSTSARDVAVRGQTKTKSTASLIRECVQAYVRGEVEREDLQELTADCGFELPAVARPQLVEAVDKALEELAAKDPEPRNVATPTTLAATRWCAARHLAAHVENHENTLRSFLRVEIQRPSNAKCILNLSKLMPARAAPEWESAIREIKQIGTLFTALNCNGLLEYIENLPQGSHVSYFATRVRETLNLIENTEAAKVLKKTWDTWKSREVAEFAELLCPRIAKRKRTSRLRELCTAVVPENLQNEFLAYVEAVRKAEVNADAVTFWQDTGATFRASDEFRAFVFSVLASPVGVVGVDRIFSRAKRLDNPLASNLSGDGFGKRVLLSVLGQSACKVDDDDDDDDDDNADDNRLAGEEDPTEDVPLTVCGAPLPPPADAPPPPASQPSQLSTPPSQLSSQRTQPSREVPMQPPAPPVLTFPPPTLPPAPRP